jgi:DNA polymerase-3 subunit epsilon
MKLFFDTETTGFPKKLPISHPSQPYIVQLAAILTTESGKEINTMNVIINNGSECIIPDAAKAVHGISTEDTYKYGIDAYSALSLFNEMLVKSDHIIAHNLDFDLIMINIAMNKVGKEIAERWKMQTLPIQYCTMKAATHIVGIPCNHAGGNKYPKLIEAYQFAFRESFKGAHDAMADCRAMMRLYWWLQDRNK